MESKKFLDCVKDCMISNGTKEAILEVRIKNEGTKMYSIQREFELENGANTGNYVYKVSLITFDNKNINKEYISILDKFLEKDIISYREVSLIDMVLTIAGEEDAKKYARKLWLIDSIKSELSVELYEKESDLIDILKVMNIHTYNPYKDKLFLNDLEGWTKFLNDKEKYFWDIKKSKFNINK